MLSWSITLAVAVCTVIGALFGWRRGLKKSGVSLISVVLAAIISFFLSGPLTRVIINEKTVYNLFATLGYADKFEEISTASPALAELVFNLPAALFAPIIFLALFYLTKLLLRIPCAIINSALSKGEKEKGPIKLIGLPLGAVQGFVAIMVIVFVCAGFIGIADGFVTTVMNDDSAALAETRSSLEPVKNLLDDIKKDPLVNALSRKPAKKVEDSVKDSTINSLSVESEVVSKVEDALENYDYGNFVFNHLSTFKFKGHTFELTKEVGAITKTTITIMPLTDNFEISKFSDEQIKIVEKFVKEFGYSEVLTEVFSDVIANACDRWSKGESFLGMAAPSFDKNVDPIMSAMFKSMRETDAGTIKIDMKTLVDILKTFDKHGVFSMFSAENKDKLMENLKGEFVSDLLTIVSNNERFNVVVPEVTNLSIKFLAESLNLPENSQEVYGSVMTDLSASIGNAMANGGLTEENVTKVSGEIKESFSKNGIEVSDEVTNIVANSMMSAFEGKEGEVTQAEIENYFKDYAAIYEAVNPESENQVKGDAIYENLANGSEAAKDQYDIANMTYKEKIDALASIGVLDYFRTGFDFTEVNGTDVIPSGVTADEFVSYALRIYNDISASKEKLGALAKTDIDSLIGLKSSEDMISNKVTAESLMVESGNCELTPEDIKNIGEGFDSITEFISSVKDIEGGVTLENIDKINIELAGKALDCFKNSSILSDKVDKIAGTVINNVAGTNENIEEVLKEGVSYESLMETVKSAGTIVNNLNKEGATDKDKNDAIMNLMETVNKENADVIVAIVNRDFMIKQGIPEAYADASATVLKETLREIAVLPAEERDGEVENIRFAFELAMSANKGDKQIIGENGVFKSYTEIVVMGVESKVISSVLVAITTDDDNNEVSDPLGIANKLSDEQKATLDAELEAYYEANHSTMSEEDVKVLVQDMNAIRLLFAMK